MSEALVPSTATERPHPVLLYDGVCGLCDKLVQFTLPRDKQGVLHYATLQSELGRGIMERHGRDPDDLKTLAVVVDRGLPTERLLLRSRAALFAVMSGLVALWYFTSDDIPTEFISMTPYVITLVVLVFASQRLRMPAADGMRWRKGQVE